MFRVGDLVDYTGKYPQAALDRWAACKVVRVDPNGAHVVNQHGVEGYMTNAQMRLAKAEPTDKELADEYRKNYLRQREIRKTLEERGYTSMMNGRAAPPMPEEASTLTFEKKIVEEI